MHLCIRLSTVVGGDLAPIEWFATYSRSNLTLAQPLKYQSSGTMLWYNGQLMRDPTGGSTRLLELLSAPSSGAPASLAQILD